MKLAVFREFGLCRAVFLRRVKIQDVRSSHPHRAAILLLFTLEENLNWGEQGGEDSHNIDILDSSSD